MMIKSLICLSLLLISAVEGEGNGALDNIVGSGTAESPLTTTFKGVALYAVSEHNRLDDSQHLILQDVVKGEMHVDGPNTKYDIIISASNDIGSINDYEVIVLDNPSQKSKSLQSFSPV